MKTTSALAFHEAYEQINFLQCLKCHDDATGARVPPDDRAA